MRIQALFDGGFFLENSFWPSLIGFVYNIPQNQLDCSQAAESAGLVVYFWMAQPYHLKNLEKIAKNLKRLPKT